MSSTKKENATPEIREFFEKSLMPTADKVRRAGGHLLVLGTDPGVSTYFETRQKQEMTRTDFESGGCDSLPDLAAQLEQLWRNESGMAGLARNLQELAARLYAGEEQTSEVSPFMYVMF